MSWWKEALFWTWCLPQTILGLLLFCFLSLAGRVLLVTSYRGTTLVKTKNSKLMGGIALGKYNFVTKRRWSDNSTIKHEYGHTVQSFMLGPLYLILVGIPSEFWLILSHFNPHIKRTYRTRYPENWADKLGGVKK